MQRADADGIVLSCDFCRRDWDGQEPMIEGHHGSIICLPCLQLALAEKKAGEGKPFSCNLCLKEQIPNTVARWSHPDGQSPAIICESCIRQSAGTFSKSPLTDWTFDSRGQ